MDLPAELRERLTDLRGDLLRGRLSGTITDAGWPACELIEAGLDTPTVWELAGYTLSIGAMEEVEPLVRQMLAESGFPSIDLQREPWAVAQDVAQGIAEGTLPIGKGADFLILELSNEWTAPFILRISRDHRRTGALGGLRLHVGWEPYPSKRPAQAVLELVSIARPAGFEPAIVGLEARSFSVAQ
ncbi:hypothetical protein AB0L65_56155 [Nonomuraea sp. NPDC052116]|uniref:hypothetical protein n=1 Tax=Nonomuraea sp. NPDC052116 TaxID=3155665 RepID=UPI00343A9BA1